MGKFFMQVCKESGLPIQRLRLFNRLTLAEFLKGKVRYLVKAIFLAAAFCLCMLYQINRNTCSMETTHCLTLIIKLKLKAI